MSKRPKPGEPVDIGALMEDGRVLDRALRNAIRIEMRRKKALGYPAVTWRDGKVVWLPPEEIPITPFEELYPEDED